MKVLMLSSAPGSIDGIRVAQYEAGQEYDLTATAGARDLAVAFVGAGLAEEVGAASAPTSDPTQQAVTDAEGTEPAAEVTAAPARPGRKPKAQ